MKHTDQTIFKCTWVTSPTSLIRPATLSMKVFSLTGCGLTTVPATLDTPLRRLSADIFEL